MQAKAVDVRLGQSKLINQKLDPAVGEVIVIEDRGVSIAPTSTIQGTRITQDRMRNIPVPGRTFGASFHQAR